MQRSRLFADKGAIGGYCIKGKSNVRRNQKPFYWAASEKSLSGRSLVKDMERICNATGAASENKPFVLPDFLPSRSDWSSATNFSAEAMPLQKARRLMALMLRVYGATQEAIDELFGLYAFRRILPTLAHQSNFTTEERLDVGGWIDPAAKTRVAMPALYSSAHSFGQIALKSELVELANSALTMFHESSDDKPLNPSWDHLFKYWPKRGDQVVLPIISEPEQKKVKLTVGPKELKELEEDDASSCTSSSSFWGEGEAAPAKTDLDDIDEPYPQELAEVNWKISTGKRGCVHILLEDGSLACGRNLKLPDEGSGLSQAFQSGRPISPRCFKALSKAGQRLWKDIDGVQ